MDDAIAADVNRLIERIASHELMLKWGEGNGIIEAAQSERDALATLGNEAPEDLRKLIDYLIERYDRLLRSIRNSAREPARRACLMLAARLSFIADVIACFDRRW